VLVPFNSTVPKATLEEAVLSVPLPPVPVTAREKEGLKNPPENTMLVLIVWAALGEKLTVKDVLRPADKVSGKFSPLISNAPLPEFTEEKLTTLLPVLVSVQDKVAVCPTTTFPKASEEGVAVRDELGPNWEKANFGAIAPANKNSTTTNSLGRGRASLFMPG
jgi:hypothetical protein